MPTPSNAPVHRRVIVILIPLPKHAVDFPDVAVAACAGDLPVVAFAVRGHRERSDSPILAHANYSPDVALAACAVDSPVVALAARARDALLSPAAGHTLALIASNIRGSGRGVGGGGIEGVARCGRRCRNSSKLRSKSLAAAAFSRSIPRAGGSSTPMEDGSLGGALGWGGGGGGGGKKRRLHHFIYRK